MARRAGGEQGLVKGKRMCFANDANVAYKKALSLIASCLMRAELVAVKLHNSITEYVVPLIRTPPAFLSLSFSCLEQLPGHVLSRVSMHKSHYIQTEGEEKSGCAVQQGWKNGW